MWYQVVPGGPRWSQVVPGGTTSESWQAEKSVSHVKTNASLLSISNEQARQVQKVLTSLKIWQKFDKYHDCIFLQNYCNYIASDTRNPRIENAKY